jgi:hypothetical protein
MSGHNLRVLSLLGSLLLVAAGPSLRTNPPRVPAAAPGTNHFIYLPLVTKAATCPATSGNAFQAGLAYQYDTDNPVRPAWNHADKNLALRSYASNPGAFLGFVSYGPPTDLKAPQLATLFSPNRVPSFTTGYQVYDWNWQPSPNPGTRGSLDTQWPVTVLGMGVTPGEALHVPSSGYDLGGGVAAIVLFADANSITLHYTRDDSGYPGYTVHVDNICTDPNLLALYNSLDTAARNTFVGPGYSYNLATLLVGQAFGSAKDTEIRVAIRDTGAFMDTRSCGDWWQIRLGRSCP